MWAGPLCWTFPSYAHGPHRVPADLLATMTHGPGSRGTRLTFVWVCFKYTRWRRQILCQSQLPLDKLGVRDGPYSVPWPHSNPASSSTLRSLNPASRYRLYHTKELDRFRPVGDTAPAQYGSTHTWAHLSEFPVCKYLGQLHIDLQRWGVWASGSST